MAVGDLLSICASFTNSLMDAGIFPFGVSAVQVSLCSGVHVSGEEASRKVSRLKGMTVLHLNTYCQAGQGQRLPEDAHLPSGPTDANARCCNRWVGSMEIQPCCHCILKNNEVSLRGTMAMIRK